MTQHDEIGNLIEQLNAQNELPFDDRGARQEEHTRGVSEAFLDLQNGALFSVNGEVIEPGYHAGDDPESFFRMLQDAEVYSINPHAFREASRPYINELANRIGTQFQFATDVELACGLPPNTEDRIRELDRMAESIPEHMHGELNELMANINMAEIRYQQCAEEVEATGSLPGTAKNVDGVAPSR